MKSIFILGMLSLSGIFFSDAYAYIDPGSGSVIFQGLIGVLVGAGIAVKLYWLKIKNYFMDRSAKKITDDKQDI